ncbi:MAG: hypothetical protein F4Z36_09850 [Acidimicrobiia bacterium]|nr:hypothetical protein [Acidimicrobiia bacterium]MYD04164.1 hypothetical protein [Acidimicrobiia bacterium]
MAEELTETLEQDTEAQDASAARLHIETWSPEYGAPLDTTEEVVSGPIDCQVETSDWSPRPPSLEGCPNEVAFVDGVRRIEARLTLDHPDDGPVPGLMAAFGVGYVQWDRAGRRSSIDGIEVERMLVMAGGYRVGLDTGPRFPISFESVPGDDPSELISHLQRRMRSAETALVHRLAGPDRLVIADGPIREVWPHPIVGYIKTHHVMYLGKTERPIIGRLRAGQRSPLFLIETRLPRYSWYLRLADLMGGHSWTGIVRGEVAAAMGINQAVKTANWATGLLPGLASEGHLDPRAPQNLVPIGALERDLRRNLGDPGLTIRALRAAVRELMAA